METEALSLSRSALRVAAVVDREKVSAWASRVLEDCLSSSDCLLITVLVAVPLGSLTAWPAPPMRSNLYDRLDMRLFRAEPDAFAQAELPVGIQVETDGAFLRSDCTELSPQAVSRLEANGIDVVIGLGVSKLRAAGPTNIALWSLEIGDQDFTSWIAGPVPELVSRKDFVVVTLRESGRSPRLAGQTRRTVTSVVQWSPRLTRNKVIWSAASLITHSLRQAKSGVPSPESANLPLDASDAPQTLGPRSPAAFAVGQITRLASHAVVRAVARDEWHVAYRNCDSRRSLGAGGGYQTLSAPRGHSYADPFLLEHGDEHWLFIEDFVYENRRARIVCVNLGDDGPGSDIIPVLDGPHHLSYPFVFERGGDIFLIPESGETGAVELFRAASFPDEWESLGTILTDLWGSDATLLEHDGLLWLFVTLARPGMHPSDELHLYFATDVLGPWKPHRMNPVVTDVRAGRSAGRIFPHDGVLVRPAQDSARRYGHAVNFQAVTLLSEADYHEETIGRLDPSQLDATAVHTYNSDGCYEVVDLLKPRMRWHR